MKHSSNSITNHKHNHYLLLKTERSDSLKRMILKPQTQSNLKTTHKILWVDMNIVPETNMVLHPGTHATWYKILGVYSCSSETLITVLKNFSHRLGSLPLRPAPSTPIFIFIIPNLIINTLAVCERRFNSEALLKLPQRMTISIFDSHKPLGVNSTLPPEVKRASQVWCFFSSRKDTVC